MTPFCLVTFVQVIDISFCGFSSNAPPLNYLYAAIPRFVLSVALLVLAVIPTLKQLVGMHKATKQWQPNKYMQQLVRDGVLYFFVYVPPFSIFHFHPFPSSAILLLCACRKLTNWLSFPEHLGMWFSTSILYAKVFLASTTTYIPSCSHFVL